MFLHRTTAREFHFFFRSIFVRDKLTYIFFDTVSITVKLIFVIYLSFVCTKKFIWKSRRVNISFGLFYVLHMGETEQKEMVFIYRVLL